MPIAELKTGGALHGALAKSLLPDVELKFGDQVGAFTIESEISRGGMAIVYVAARSDGEISQRVALKWLQAAPKDTAVQTLFRRERNILAGLDHPGIARLIDGGRTDAGLWFAMELVQGQSIDEYANQKALGVRQRVQLVISLCDALAAAHASLLVHRDIKPANVLVDQNGRIKLLDFGIASLINQTDGIETSALTPSFSSPEQWQGLPVGIGSDIYQLGLLLAHLLCPAVLESDQRRADQQHLTTLWLKKGIDAGINAERQSSAPRLNLSLLPKALRAIKPILACATAFAPAARYASVLALREDLQRYLAARPLQAANGNWRYRLVLFAKRHPLGTGAGVLGTCALVLLAASLWQQYQAAQLAAREAGASAAIASAASQRSSAALKFVTEMTQWATPSKSGGQTISIDDALADAVQKIESELHDQPQLRAELQYVFGEIYLQRRERSKARPLLEAAYAVLSQTPAANALQLARCEAYLAFVLNEAPLRARAIVLARSAIKRHQDFGFKRDNHYFNARHILASRLLQVGQLSAAIDEFDAAIEEIPAHLGTGTAHEAMLRIYKADVEDLLNDAVSAESLRLRELSMNTALKNYGERHPTSSGAVLDYAQTLVAAGKLDSAAALLAKDQAVRAKLWPPNHAEFARWRYVMSELLLERGEVKPAEVEIRGAIAHCCKDLKQGTRYLNAYYRQLGRALAKQNLFTQAIEAYRQALLPVHFDTSVNPDFGETRLLLIQALRATGRAVEISAELGLAEQESSVLPAAHSRRLALVKERTLTR